MSALEKNQNCLAICKILLKFFCENGKNVREKASNPPRGS